MVCCFRSHVAQADLLEFNTSLDRMLASEISSPAVCSCAGDDYFWKKEWLQINQKKVLVPLHENGWFHHLISHWRHLLVLGPPFNVSSVA